MPSTLSARLDCSSPHIRTLDKACICNFPRHYLVRSTCPTKCLRPGDTCTTVIVEVYRVPPDTSAVVQIAATSRACERAGLPSIVAPGKRFQLAVERARLLFARTSINRTTFHTCFVQHIRDFPYCGNRKLVWALREEFRFEKLPSHKQPPTQSRSKCWTSLDQSRFRWRGRSPMLRDSARQSTAARDIM